MFVGLEALGTPVRLVSSFIKCSKLSASTIAYHCYRRSWTVRSNLFVTHLNYGAQTLIGVTYSHPI